MGCSLHHETFLRVSEEVCWGLGVSELERVARPKIWIWDRQEMMELGQLSRKFEVPRKENFPLLESKDDHTPSG